MNDQRRRPPTMADVAARAGVTRITASSVLNDRKPGVRVSDETRRLIREAADELNYFPSEIANSLKRRKTDTIGFLNVDSLLSSTNPFTAQIIGGLVDGAVSEGRDLLVHRNFTTDDIRRTVFGGKIDGLILHAQNPHDLLDMLTKSHLPIVAIVDALDSFPSVVVDDYSGGRQIAHHFHERGYKRILYRKRAFEIYTSLKRYEGFMAAAAELQLDVTVSTFEDDEYLSEKDTAYISKTNLPFAVTGWRDLSLLAVADKCLALGLRIPEDVGLAGFDGMQQDTEFLRQLTTIVAPWGEVAKVGAAILTQLIEGYDVPAVTAVPVALRVGSTT